MAGVKISVLPPGGEIQGSDLLPVARGLTTFSVRGDVIFPVTEPKLGTNSVSNRALSANVVSLDKIRTIPGNRVLGNNSGSQGNVAAVQVVEGMIADDAVTSAKIKDGEVKTVNILNNAVTLGKIEQVAANKVLGAVVTGNVIETQVLEGMIANDAVTSVKIKDGEVKNANIADGAVNRNKIATNEVMFTNLQQIGATTNSVICYTNANTNAQALKITRDFITDLTITGAKLADLTITGGKIANSTITSDKLAFSIPAQAAPIPTGGIIMWSGANVPAGWVLCNGQNGTPDLRGRFIVGAGNSYSVGNIGGSADAIVVSHAHTITDPGHSHSRGVVYPGNQTEQNQGGGPEDRTNFNQSTGSSTTGITINSSGESGVGKNLPPYYALAFIMKL